MADLFNKMIMSTFSGCWQPIKQLEDKYTTNLLLCAPELVDLDYNPAGIGMGYFQDDFWDDNPDIAEAWSGTQGGSTPRGGAFLCAKWNMTSDEWYETPCTPTHFILMEGPDA